MRRQWFKSCQPCRHECGFLVVFTSFLVILVITVNTWHNCYCGTYMIWRTINCYYLMYLHYNTLIGIVRQDHNPLLCTWWSISRKTMFQLDGWTCQPTKATCELSRGTCIQWSVLVYAFDSTQCAAYVCVDAEWLCVGGWWLLYERSDTCHVFMMRSNIYTNTQIHTQIRTHWC